jgi:hypothetical protein
MTRTVEIVHEHGHIPVAASALCNASEVLCSILSTAEGDTVVRLPMFEFSEAEIKAFVVLCELVGNDGCSLVFGECEPLTLIQFLKHQSTQVTNSSGATRKPTDRQWDETSTVINAIIIDAIPVVHKYDAGALQQLCMTRITVHPTIETISAYETCYSEECVWPDAIIGWLVKQTLPSRYWSGDWCETDVDSLRNMNNSTLIAMLHCVHKSTWSGPEGKLFRFDYRKEHLFN